MAIKTLTTGFDDGYALRICFAWQVDRYTQTILLLSEDGDVLPKQTVPPERALLTSIEGNREQDWPASPPMQDLNFHDVPSGSRAALAVGMAGKSHWSIVWEASQDEPVLVCDVACRVKEPPGYLASTWKIADGLAVDDELRIECGPQLFAHISVLDDDEFAAASEHSAAEICLSARPPADPPPTTVRWRYRIGLQQNV